MDIMTYALLKSKLGAKADLINGKIPAEQLPSYVDDVIEYPSLADFPEEGEESKIYVALDTNLTYRWSGSQYVQIGGQEISALTTEEIEDIWYPSVTPKGTVIKMNLDGTERRYLVLKENHHSVKVLGLFNVINQWFNRSTTNFGHNKKQYWAVEYDTTTVYSYLNDTWYNTFTTKAKNAIVPETILQTVLFSSTDVYYATVFYDWEYTGNDGQKHTTKYGLNMTDYYVEMSYNIRSLSFNDIVDFCDASETHFIDGNYVREKFEVDHLGSNALLIEATDNQKSDSLRALSSSIVTSTHGNNGGSYVPVFNIDLSQIDYTIEDN